MIYMLSNITGTDLYKRNGWMSMTDKKIQNFTIIFVLQT